MLLRLFFSVQFIGIIHVLYGQADYSNEWRVVETLAEEHPYIVALLNFTQDYLCSGTIIARQTVLTSGFCLSPVPSSVAVGLALLRKNKAANVFDVAYTLTHDDYTYVMNTTEPDKTKIHSNIGLVFMKQPVLELFVPAASIGSYFASELSEVELTTVGYGRRYKRKTQETFMLQYQCYDQSPCLNPRWYYCICGTEIPTVEPSHGKDFGKGAPVLFGTDVVCVTATSTDAPILKSADIKFGIFTVIGAYIPWIEKIESAPTMFVNNNKGAAVGSLRTVENEAQNSADCNNVRLSSLCIYYWLLESVYRN